MGMMEHIAFQSFWQRGKTFAHSKGTEIPSLPSVFTVDPYCPCSFDSCGLLKVHGRMRQSVTWCTKRGFCLPSSWSWAELQQPVASREEQSVVERWSYDEIPTFCNIPKASQKPKALKTLLKGWHLRQILELLQRLPSHNFAGGFDNCRVHLRAGRWTVDTWHILTHLDTNFSTFQVALVALSANNCLPSSHMREEKRKVWLLQQWCWKDLDVHDAGPVCMRHAWPPYECTKIWIFICQQNWESNLDKQNRTIYLSTPNGMGST